MLDVMLQEDNGNHPTNDVFPEVQPVFEVELLCSSLQINGAIKYILLSQMVSGDTNSRCKN